jgi:hypothetical protein
VLQVADDDDQHTDEKKGECECEDEEDSECCCLANDEEERWDYDVCGPRELGWANARMGREDLKSQITINKLNNG